MLNIYRASAGSGKTFRLTKDYIFLLFKSHDSMHPHRRILAVTFTNKATDEMKNRILQELYTLASGGKSNYRESLMKELRITEQAVNERAKSILIHILHDYSVFSISTIDKFFQQVVRSFAREIGVNGGYNIELDTDTTLQQAVDDFFIELSDAENKQLLEWMTVFLEERIEDSEDWNMRKSLLELGKEIFKENYQHKAEETTAKLQNRDFLRQYRLKLRKVRTDFEEKVRKTAEEILNLLEINNLQPGYFTRSMMFKTLENLRDSHFEIGMTFLSYAEAPENCYTKSQKDKEIIGAIHALYYNGLQEKLREIIDLVQSEELTDYYSVDIVLKHLDTLGILFNLSLQIKKLTNDQNVMLLSDTNMLLNKVIDNSDTPFVYERTGINIDHFMIDEFQDTSVLQWENFKPLVLNSLADGFSNMVVGDVKQSIYRWRNSDWKLLDEQVNLDFPMQQLKEETLNINWRSDKHIVEFNNDFFRRAADTLQVKLNNQIANETSGKLQKLTEKITHAYKDIEQHVSEKAGTGHVRFEFISGDEAEDGWHAASLQRLPNLLENLIDNGYKPSDIAFLVRKNSHTTEIIEFLLKYKNSSESGGKFTYDIVGNEGLLLTSSASVSFLLALLHVSANPNDHIQRTIMNFEYLRGKKKMSENDAMQICFQDKKDEYVSAESALFTPAENECIVQLRNSSLFDAVEKLIRIFQLHNWYDETVFLQAFQDVIFKSVSSGYSDLNSFLLWWEEKGAKQAITTPENENGFRIMTVHKAKGLDFKVVIMPFCDWKLDAEKNPLMWCEPSKAPFNELPLLPINYASKLGNSIFKEQYFDEKMHQYIDNLNTAYVAFTRARNEMFCFAPSNNNPEKLSVDSIKNLSDLLQFCFLDEQNSFSLYFDKEKNTFEIGECQRIVYQDNNSSQYLNKIESYPSVSSEERLKIRHISMEFWKYEKSISENRINFGIILHEILQKTIRKGDEKKVIQELIFAGRINEKEREIVSKEMANFWNLPEVAEWFSPDVQVLNEATILLPNGDSFRPDRVIFKGKKAAVIEYKFGEEEHSYHVRQLNRYIGFLQEMNYEVEGFLYYVSLGKIIKA